MRPQILPGLPQLWRDTKTLQIGIDSRRAVVLTNVHRGIAEVVSKMDGQHNLVSLTNSAARHGYPAHEADELINMLLAAGVVTDASAVGKLPAKMGSETRRRLAPDLAALRLSQPSSGEPLLANRAHRCVEIHARGRIGPVLAALLAASGVGHIAVIGQGNTHAADACIGGLLPEDEHRPYATAAADAVRRAAPEARVYPRRPSRRVDMTVFTDFSDHYRATTLATTPTPRAMTSVFMREATAVIGPLLVPGRTPCLRCLDLHKSDNDPAWPVMAAQLATAPPTVEASHTATAIAAAGLAAMQILTLFDGGEPDTLGTALEIDHLSGHIRRRRWTKHPRCACSKTTPTSGAGYITTVSSTKPLQNAPA